MANRTAGKRGKLQSFFPRTVGTLRDYLQSPLPTPPASFDYASKVQSGFPMACNDSLSCCTISGVVHLLQLAYAVVGETFPYPGDDAVREAYTALTGGQDSGLVETDVLREWSTEGLFGTKLIGWAPIDIRDRPLMAAACYSFGALYLGGVMPDTAESEFENGQWWHLEPGNHPGTSGHCFVGSGANEKGIPDITWGAEDGFTWEWWKYYGSNAYVVIPDIFQQVGHGPLAAINTEKLRADLAALDK